MGKFLISIHATLYSSRSWFGSNGIYEENESISNFGPGSIRKSKERDLVPNVDCIWCCIYPPTMCTQADIRRGHICVSRRPETSAGQGGVCFGEKQGLDRSLTCCSITNICMKNILMGKSWTSIRICIHAFSVGFFGCISFTVWEYPD